jgi:predicted TPR repeat methyltransferase/uncharacterized coiled-coil protein SlyX
MNTDPPRDPAVDDSRAPLAPAIALFHRRELAQAAARCRAILESEPDRVDALNLLGAVEGERGRFDAAIECLRRAVALQPDHHGSLINLAMALGLNARDEEALTIVERVLELKPADAQALHVRGSMLRRLGRLFDALASLDQSLAADPEQVEVLVERGELLAELSDLGMRRRDEAVQSLRRAIALGGDEASIRFSLAAMGAGQAPPAPPESFVTQLFDRYADRFDKQLLEDLAYRAPELVGQAVLKAAPPAGADVLDLGCGTGLCGPFLRPLAGRLVGVDLSRRMLAKATERALYDELVQADIVQHLSTSADSVDLIVAADVLVYLGDLGPLFSAAQRALNPGGCFVFTVESHGGDDDYVLCATRRYAHTDAYVRRVADEFGFEVDALLPCVLRTNNGADVEGRLVTLRRPGRPNAAPEPPVDPVEARLVELEIKASFAEDTLDQLNQVIVRQQQQIDALARELARWRDQATAASPEAPRSLRDELPPHY